MRLRKLLTVGIGICLTALLCINVHASQDMNLSLTVRQEFLVENAKESQVDQKTFYTFTSMDEPEKDLKFTLDGNDSYEVPLHFQHAGVYQYQLLPQVEEKENYTYDAQPYTIVVYVNRTVDGLEGQIVVKNTANKKVGEIIYQNAYRGPEVPVAPEKNDSAATSDQSNVGMYAMTTILSGLILFLCGKNHRRA